MFTFLRTVSSALKVRDILASHFSGLGQVTDLGGPVPERDDDNYWGHPGRVPANPVCFAWGV